MMIIKAAGWFDIPEAGRANMQVQNDLQSLGAAMESLQNIQSPNMQPMAQQLVIQLQQLKTQLSPPQQQQTGTAPVAQQAPPAVAQPAAV